MIILRMRDGVLGRLGYLFIGSLGDCGMGWLLLLGRLVFLVI